MAVLKSGRTRVFVCGYGSPYGHRHLHAHRASAVWAPCGIHSYRSIGVHGYTSPRGHRSRRPPHYAQMLTHASFVFVLVFFVFVLVFSSTLLCRPP